MATMMNSLPQPITIKGADRGIFGGLVDSSAQRIADEDFMRDLQKMAYTNQFNANEAEIKRQWDERMQNSLFQRTVADMKSVGINPIIGLGLSGGSTPQGGQASGSTSSSSGYTGRDSGLLGLLGTIASVVAGVYTNGASNATKLAVARTTHKTKHIYDTTKMRKIGFGN